MNEVQHPATTGLVSFQLLDRCADFYQEIVSIKSAQAEGRLAAYLAPNEVQPIVLPSDLAQRCSARLLNLLRQQERNFRREVSVEVSQNQKIALYLMAVLADEIFIFELDWTGRDAWLDVLIETKLFNTNNAGSRFFSLAQQMINKPARNTSTMELAAVFLMVLELGFKGCYRGGQGHVRLLNIREQLYQVIAQCNPDLLPVNPNIASDQWSIFTQPYQYPLQHGLDERLAPVSPWKNMSLYALASYLLLSVIVWFVLMYPFEKYIGS